MAIKRWQPLDEIKHWEPFGEIDSLRQEMNRLLEQFVPVWAESSRGYSFAPAAEVNETDTEVHLRLEVPGMEADDLDVEVTDKTVAIKGERKSESETSEQGSFRSEFYYGQFERVIPLPSRIEKDEVTAEYKNGVLSLTLPKAPEEAKKSVKVNLS